MNQKYDGWKHNNIGIQKWVMKKILIFVRKNNKNLETKKCGWQILMIKDSKLINNKKMKTIFNFGETSRKTHFCAQNMLLRAKTWRNCAQNMLLRAKKWRNCAQNMLLRAETWRNCAQKKLNLNRLRAKPKTARKTLFCAQKVVETARKRSILRAKTQIFWKFKISRWICSAETALNKLHVRKCK